MLVALGTSVMIMSCALALCVRASLTCGDFVVSLTIPSISSDDRELKSGISGIDFLGESGDDSVEPSISEASINFLLADV